ncbi:hypothetical protein DY000_02061492 [Brassica cretica]|uniref:Uncharacterized protein n=1 Tax=Brassica cretica TaxID=69181 RepID=A0ABQ7AYJ4_BRACR|nr:hypothetical protein DY000_02061492 [Brassica cretica]
MVVSPVGDKKTSRIGGKPRGPPSSDDVDSASGVDKDFRKDGAFDFQCDHQGIVVGHIKLYSFVLVESHDLSFSYCIFGGDDGGIVNRLSRSAKDRLSRVSIFLDAIGLIDLKRSRSIDLMQLDWIGMGSIVALRKLKSVS